MPFDIQQFRSELGGDGARPNLFEISLPLPSAGFASVGGALDFNRKITFMARTAQLPGSTMGMVNVPYFGRDIKVPGNRQFGDWSVTIINDEDFTVRNAMEKWMNALNSHRTNLRDPAAYNNTQYTADAIVSQMGKRGESIGGIGVGGRPGALKRYKFIGVWPTDVAPIELDWASNDTLEEFQVTFAYNWWETIEDGVTT